MKRQGFTLIELMVVIAVIGLLSAIALPRFTNITKDAEIAQIQANRYNIQTSLSMYTVKEDKPVVSLFDEDGTLTDNIFGKELEKVLDNQFAPFFKYYEKSKLPTLPKTKRYKAVYLTEDQVSKWDFEDNYNTENTEGRAAWIFTDRGNVYPVISEEVYGIRFDEF